jgi:hypothetical protein
MTTSLDGHSSSAISTASKQRITTLPKAERFAIPIPEHIGLKLTSSFTIPQTYTLPILSPGHTEESEVPIDLSVIPTSKTSSLLTNIGVLHHVHFQEEEQNTLEEPAENPQNINSESLPSTETTPT